MNIYIGNLSYQVNEDDLRAAFEAFGEVSSARIINDRDTGRSKGFGFVEMPEDAEAKEAMASLNGTEISDRTITVNEAKAKQPGGGGRGGGQSRGGYGGGGYGGGGNRY